MNDTPQAGGTQEAVVTAVTMPEAWHARIQIGDVVVRCPCVYGHQTAEAAQRCGEQVAEKLAR